MGVLFCLLALLLACVSSPLDPLGDIRRFGGDLVLVNATVLYLGLDVTKATGTAATWQERLTLGLRLVLFVILLLCGDVECNPGPDIVEIKVINKSLTHVHYVLVSSYCPHFTCCAVLI